MYSRFICRGHPFNRLCKRSRPWFTTMIVGLGLTVPARGQEAVKAGAPPEAYLPGDPLPYFGMENSWDWNPFKRPHDPINQSARIGQG